MKKENKAELTERFLAALKENGNSITGAAKTLNINRYHARKIARENGVVPNEKKVPPPCDASRNTRPDIVANKMEREAQLLARLPGLLAELRSKDKAAKVLRTNKRTVLRLMKEHNLSVPVIDKDLEISRQLPELLVKHGSQASVAKILKVGERTISRVMKKYNITRQKPVQSAAPTPTPKQVTKANPDRYANIRERLPQLFAEHKSQAGVARALGVDKKTISRALKATGYKPPQVLPGPAAGTKSKQKGSTPFNNGRVFRFVSSDSGEAVIVEYCADPKLEKARARLLQSDSQNDDAVWEVHQAYGVPLRDVYRLRYENRERAKGRM